MTKKSNEEILQELLKKLLAMPIPNLYEILVSLDIKRRGAVINMLPPKKFKALAQYETGRLRTETELWIDDMRIGRTQLHALNPKELWLVSKKGCANTLGWGKWYEMKGEANAPVCASLANYFSGCSVKRAVEIIVFFLEHSRAVTAPRHLFGTSIYRYKEGREFPFEIVRLFSTMHPELLFKAVNTMPVNMFKRMLWFAKKILDDSEYLENVLADSYGHAGKEKGIYHNEIVEALVSHAPILQNKHLNLLLLELSTDTQRLITKAVGRERLVQMRAERCLSSKIEIDESVQFYRDVKPNDIVMEKLASGEQKVSRLSAKKAAELLGELSKT